MDVLASDVILMATMSTRGVFGGEGAVVGGWVSTLLFRFNFH